MHARNARTHQHAAGDHPGPAHVLPAYDVQRNDGGEDGGSQ